MIDTMTSPSNPKVVICSTIMNVAPLEMMLWRNYGYRAGQETVYKVPPRPATPSAFFFLVFFVFFIVLVLRFSSITTELLEPVLWLGYGDELVGE